MTRQPHLNPVQQKIQQLLLDEETSIFTMEELRRHKDFAGLDLQHSLEVLVKTNFLRRLEKGKYCLFNFSDEHVIATYLAPGGAIAYWSALHLHGLTEQFPNTVFVQTDRLKRDKRVFGVAYKFIKVLPRKMVGTELRGFGKHQYRITDLEKTIVDCFDLPQYAGGYAELIRAVQDAELDGQKLITYCRAVGNIAATKRLAFLVELFEKNNCRIFLEYAKNELNKKYSLFNPLGEDKGKYYGKWKLRLNMSQEDILEIAGKTY